jgi:hypothetical protein
MAENCSLLQPWAKASPEAGKCERGGRRNMKAIRGMRVKNGWANC